MEKKGREIKRIYEDMKHCRKVKSYGKAGLLWCTAVPSPHYDALKLELLDGDAVLTQAFFLALAQMTVVYDQWELFL